MRWGKVPADVAGQVMVDALDCMLYFASFGRLTVIWEARSLAMPPHWAEAMRRPEGTADR